MKKYIVNIEELLTKSVEVIAENEEQAEELVREAYDEQKIILTADDYCGPTDFFVQPGAEDVEEDAICQIM